MYTMYSKNFVPKDIEGVFYSIYKTSTKIKKQKELKEVNYSFSTKIIIFQPYAMKNTITYCAQTNNLILSYKN